MIRGQLCLYVHSADRYGWSPAGGVGIIEAPVGAFAPERVLSFVGHHINDQNLMISLGEYSAQEVPDYGEEIAGHVTSSIWPRPTPGTGIIGGGLLFRKTRLSARAGYETLIFSTCLYAPAQVLAHQKRYSIIGRTTPSGSLERLVIHDPIENELLSQIGIGMNALLKQPAWGWGTEPFALQSTMHLDTIDQCSEIRRLLDQENRTGEEETRLQQLRHTPAWSVINLSRDDKTFGEFLQRIQISDPFDDWTKPVTSHQLERHGEQVSAIIRELIN